MEDRLSRLLFGRWGHVKVKNSVAVLDGLASAVVDINNLFIDTKHTFRSYVVSIFAADADEKDMVPVGTPVGIFSF